MGIPFLKNFRRGFATNSSSSHSFVYLKENVPTAFDDSLDVPDEFSWNDFRLDTIKEKLFYVLTTMLSGGSWNSEDPTERAAEAYREHAEEFPELSQEDFDRAAQSYVDHQSLWTIGPVEARNPSVVVFGGNDNGGESHERAQVVRSGKVDWTRTAPEWSDQDNVRPDDEEGQKALKQSRMY